jgi:hypothetical protein
MPSPRGGSRLQAVRARLIAINRESAVAALKRERVDGGATVYSVVNPKLSM